LEREPIAKSSHVQSHVGGTRGPNDRALAGLRIAVGLLFLLFGEYKVFGREFVFGGGFQGWIQRFLAEGSAYPFMVRILQGVVLPHGRAIALLVAYGELAIGLSLVLGLWVRLASSCGLVYMLALLFSANYPGPQAVLWQYFGAALEHLVFALCFATFVVGAPERAWSLARVWRRRWSAQ
jgi:thiosulfate dehydrogenase (quinone) large subunit